MNISKNIKLLKWFNFFSDFSLFSPIAILYFTQVTGSFALGMSIFSVSMISAALFEVPTGIFSDRIGRKKTMTLGAISFTLSVLFYAIGGFYAILIIGAILSGLGRSFYSGNNQALLYDTLLEDNQESKFHNYLGSVSSMFQLALAISALLGSFIAAWSFSLVVWLTLIPNIICIVISLKIYEPKRHSKKLEGNIYTHLSDAVREFLKNKRLRLLSISDVLKFGIGEASFTFSSAFIALVWPIWAIGLSKALTFAAGALSFKYSGKIIDKYNPGRLLIISSLYNRISNLIALIFPTVFSPILLNSNALLYGVSSVSTSMLMQKEYTHEKRATMDSLNSLAGSLFFGIFAIILGFSADKIGVIPSLIIVQFLSMSVFFIYYKLFRK